MTGVPASLADAQSATQGLFEVSFLPKMEWDTNVVAEAQTGDHGKVDDIRLTRMFADTTGVFTDEFFGALGRQTNCILYYQGVDTRRRTGDVNRTGFMYTLDRLGYGGEYDVYDHQGLGNSNNHLASRANYPQATGYALIIYDVGNRSPDGSIMPDGDNMDDQKIHQAQWFQSYLPQGASSEIGIANFWMIGSNAMEERPTAPLYTSEMAVTFVGPDQALHPNPAIDGVATMNYSAGNFRNYNSDYYYTFGIGSPQPRNYDALEANSNGVSTHRWAPPGFVGNFSAAVVQRANIAGNWNTIMMAFPPSDLVPSGLQPSPAKDLVGKTLFAVLPPNCFNVPVDVGDGDTPEGEVPRNFALNGAYPNPFNPLTTIRFDVPRSAVVTLKIYDVAGRLVKTLQDTETTAGAHNITWNGMDGQGKPVASGIYFVHMRAKDFVATQKLVMTK